MLASFNKLAVLAAGLLATTASALTTADVATVFPAGSTLSGTTTSLQAFDFSVIHNTTHALYTLNATRSALSAVGWMAVGAGQSMAQSDMIIAWPSSGSWTLSHRRARGQVMPQVASPAADTYTYLPALSTTDAASPFAAVSFIRPIQPGASYPAGDYNVLSTTGRQSFVYASSSTRPASAAENAMITQHNQGHATFALDLSTSFATAGTPSTGDSDDVPVTGGAASRTRSDMLIVAHAVIMSLAFAIFMPLATLLGRFGRRFSWWFKAHAALQLFAVIFVIIGFALGVYVVGMPGFISAHQRLGLALFILVILQAAGGAFAHKTKGSELGEHVKGKSPIRWLHIASGVAIIVIGWIEIGYLGFDEWAQKSDAQTPVPKAVMGVFWAVVGVMSASWIAGWALALASPKSGGRRSSLDEKENFATHRPSMATRSGSGSGTP